MQYHLLKADIFLVDSLPSYSLKWYLILRCDEFHWYDDLEYYTNVVHAEIISTGDQLIVNELHLPVVKVLQSVSIVDF